MGRCSIEIPAFPVDGALENERFARMGLAHLLNEGEQPLANLFFRGVGEGVKDEAVHGGVGKGIGKIGLHLAVAAAAQAEQLDAGAAGELGGVCHAATGGAYPVRETGAVNAYPVPEGVGEGFDMAAFPYANLDGIFFAEDG